MSTRNAQEQDNCHARVLLSKYPPQKCFIRARQVGLCCFPGPNHLKSSVEHMMLGGCRKGLGISAPTRRRFLLVIGLCWADVGQGVVDVGSHLIELGLLVGAVSARRALRRVVNEAGANEANGLDHNLCDGYAPRSSLASKQSLVVSNVNLRGCSDIHTRPPRAVNSPGLCSWIRPGSRRSASRQRCCTSNSTGRCSARSCCRS